LKFLSPFLAKAVSGIDNRLRARTREMSVRLLMLFLMTFLLERWKVKATPNNAAVDE